MPSKRGVPLAERFWSHVAIAEPLQCWLWHGGTQRGYGAMRLSLPGVGRRQVNAQRVAFVLTYGPIDAIDHVLHRCDTPLCCNPTHLFVGDRAANMQDAAAKGRMSTVKQRATREQFDLAGMMLHAGGSIRGVARATGVSQPSVRRLKRSMLEEGRSGLGETGLSSS